LAAETLLELLVGLVEDSGMTLVLVTHDARVAAYGQREIVVRDGRTSTTANNPVAGA
jgi:putative ABC transport system ATP-binding protein